MDFYLDLSSKYPFVDRFETDAAKPFGYKSTDDEMASLVECEPVLSLLADLLRYVRGGVVPEVSEAVEGIS